MNMPLSAQAELRLIKFIHRDRSDPLAFVKSAYPWGKGELTASKGPRQWQAEVLDDIGKHLRNPATMHTPYRMAIASGHGVGKSSLISMVCHWAMSTVTDTKILVTANTETQLRTKTWPEVSKWFRLGINAHWFKLTATSVYIAEVARERTWRADAIPWSLNSTESFAGLHNKGRRIVVIMDEASAIPADIFEVVEGALTDEDTEIIWLAFGNPTRNSGRFRELFGKFKHRWKTQHIDSRTVEGTNKEQFRQWCEDYGEDSDFVRVRVRGEFPRAGAMQFIPSDWVEMARKREPEAKLYDPLVLGCDIARLGDNETVLAPRRGRDAKTIPWQYLRGLDTMQTAARIMEMHNEYRFDAIFVDGGGVGGGVVDRLRQLNYPVLEVQFGASPDFNRGFVQEGAVRYANKRAEMYGAMKEWLKGGMIPDDPDLAAQLSSLEYGYVQREGIDKIILEKKRDMMDRCGILADRSDALCTTFAYPVLPSDHSGAFQKKGTNHQSNYNPLSREYVGAELSGSNYNPFGR